MATIPDITSDRLETWDQYKDRSPDEVLQAVYAHIDRVSRQVCGWYWASIRTKRNTSLAVRGLSFLLLTLGSILPLWAALHDAVEVRLLFTQLAVGFLVMAGLSQLADRVFGWSSGWMRYITTVTTMESLSRAFELAWARHLVERAGPPTVDDARKLFDLARALEQALMKLQADETMRWVAEFNSGIALLDTMIKTSREDADRRMAALRTETQRVGPDGADGPAGPLA